SHAASARHAWPLRPGITPPLARSHGRIRVGPAHGTWDWQHRYARLPLEWAVEDLNRLLRGWGELLPVRKLRTEVLPDRRLCQRTPRDPRQHQHGLTGRNRATRFNYQ